VEVNLKVLLIMKYNIIYTYRSPSLGLPNTP